MLNILFWVSVISGGILVLLLLMSLVGGLDLDLDMESPDADADTDSGGLGLIKGTLTFVSVASWVMKIALTNEQGNILSTVIGVAAGIFAFLLLNYLFKILLSTQINVNYSIEDALFQSGSVYLKIPSTEGNGIVQLKINGANREFKAKSLEKVEIKTGAKVRVAEVGEGFVYVIKEI